MRRVVRGALVTGVVLAAAGVVDAHEVGVSRFESPVPIPLMLGGAALTIAFTAGWLALGESSGEREWRLGGFPSDPFGGIVLGFRWGFFVAFVVAIVAGLIGPRTATENPATLFVWPVWLKGIILIAAVLGSPWRVLSPWRTMYDAICRLEGRAIVLVGGYPERLGHWPAFVGFVVWLGVIENLTPAQRSPRLTASLIAGYAGIMLIGALVFGRKWFERADALEVFYRLVGRVAPVRLDTRGGEALVVVRPPWQGCTAAVSFVAGWLVVAAVFTVSFDAFTNTAPYQSLVFAGRRFVGQSAGIAVYFWGLAAYLAAFGGVAAAAEGRAGWRDSVRAYAPTVIPIAVGYEIAHNYPFVIRSLGQLVGVLAGTDAPAEPLWWLSLPAFWWSQVALIVGGHVVAVIASHNVARSRAATRWGVLRSHGILTVLMVGYTVLSLWIVSRPIAG